MSCPIAESLDALVYIGNIPNMIDLSLIEGFEWDEGNSLKSAEKHGVSPGEAEQVLLNEPLAATDDKHSTDEPRFWAFGQTDGGRRLHVTFTLRNKGRLIRIISARDMSRKERAFYEGESHEH